MKPQPRKGSELSMFKGKAVRLNRVILLILNSKKLPAKYDVFIEIRSIKGFKHEDSKTVYRRMEALNQEGWITQKGKRQAKPGWPSELYELPLRGKAALKLDQKNIEEFLPTASEEQLARFIDLL